MEGLSHRARLALTARMAWQAPREGRFLFKSPQAIRRVQQRRLRAAVAHAYHHVPYYRERMRRQGLAPDDICDAADLALLPLLEREDLQRDPERFASDVWPRAACVTLRSGGTTGAPVIETPLIGFECEAHRGYHLNVDVCPIRLVDPEGARRGPRRRRRVVVSNLLSRGTVVLNYRLGDLAATLPGACSCGRNLPLLGYIQGRVSGWLDLGDGRMLHPQALRGAVLRAEADVWRYQLIQEERRRFLFRLVVRPDCDREAAADRIGSRFADLVGRDVALRVEFVPDLPRGPSGKVAPIVALRPTDPRPAPAPIDHAPPR